MTPKAKQNKTKQQKQNKSKTTEEASINR